MSRQQQRSGTAHERTRTAGAFLALAVAAVLPAGCSSGSPGTGSGSVASLPGHTGVVGGAKPLTQQQGDQDMVSFTRCMRAHGVRMSDPFHRPGHTGLSIDMPPQDSATHTAYSACNHFMAPVFQMKAAGMAAHAAPNLPALTRYAECMRGHDISMLDPTPQGVVSLGHVPGTTSNFGRNSPQFRAADAACRHLLPAGVQDDGSGP
ncbi:MAG TPA: hypothetical protein VGS19_19180 [Streptosporangiaceae bacterium]|nr:hypothetical protein [Streptosporangiaceae bacterium]